MTPAVALHDTMNGLFTYSLLGLLVYRHSCTWLMLVDAHGTANDPEVARAWLLVLHYNLCAFGQTRGNCVTQHLVWQTSMQVSPC